jgi:hypothetical protein
MNALGARGKTACRKESRGRPAKEPSCSSHLYLVGNPWARDLGVVEAATLFGKLLALSRLEAAPVHHPGGPCHRAGAGGDRTGDMPAQDQPRQMFLGVLVIRYLVLGNRGNVRLSRGKSSPNAARMVGVGEGMREDGDQLRILGSQKRHHPVGLTPLLSFL